MGIKLIATNYTKDFLFTVNGEPRVPSDAIFMDDGNPLKGSSLALSSILSATFENIYFIGDSIICTNLNGLMYIFPRHCFTIEGAETNEVH